MTMHLNFNSTSFFFLKGTPHMDLNLKSSPGDADIRLVRTVQHVLACRYQPARLNSTAMAKQLKDARVCQKTNKNI